MRIAYLTGRYPQVSHTFIHREVEALRRRGVAVRTLSVWRTDDADLLTATDRAERDATYHVFPPRPGHIALAVVRALAMRRARVASTLRRSLQLARPGLRWKLMAVLWWLEAMLLWDRLRVDGIRHLHAHIGGTAPSVCLLVAHLGNDGGARRRWTWSLTVHGPTEFYDVHGEALADKVRDADVVVAISDFGRSQLLGLVEEEHWAKVHVVHCGVQPAVFAAEAPNAAPDGPLRVLNVSRLVPVKGTAVLLEAVAHLRGRGVEVACTIVGDGDRRSALQRIAERLGVGEQVTFAGAVGQDRIRAYYADADVFCLPSFGEGVPVVLMEAMAMRRPVVTTQVMGVTELVSHGVEGLVVAPGRADLLADALAELADDAGLRARLGEAGRAKVIAEFDVDQSAARLEALFRAVADSDPVSGAGQAGPGTS